MSKPSVVLGWNPPDDAIQDPGSTKLAGWVGGFKPPAEWFNWLFHVISLWVDYLNGLTGEPLTWTMKHTFSGGLESGVTPEALTDVVRLWDVGQMLAPPAWTFIAAGAAFSYIGGGESVPGYYKDAAGTVHLKGTFVSSQSASGGSGIGLSEADALAVGCRPAEPVSFPVLDGALGSMGLLSISGGQIAIIKASPRVVGDRVVLDGISFRAGA